VIQVTPRQIHIQIEVALRDKGRGRFQKRERLGFWVLAGVGMMIFLLSGCGSDSTPKQAASGKKEKTAKTSSTLPKVTPLTSAPSLKQFDRGRGTVTAEDIEAKRVAAEKEWQKLGPKDTVLPGYTKEQLEADLQAHQAKMRDPNHEIVPGLTVKQCEAQREAQRAKMRDPNHEILPGLSVKQLEAQREAQRAKMRDPNHEIFPGLSVKQLETQREAQRAKMLDPNREIFPGLTVEQAKAKAAQARQMQ
jgi:hypothetical protein